MNISTHIKGFTLIELMVGLLLTAVFVSSVIPVAVHMRDNFNAQNNLSNMMEDGRYTIETTGKEIRRAGYLRNRLVLDGESAFEAVSNNDLFGSGLGRLSSMDAGEFVKGEDNNSNSYSDSFIIRYQLHDANEIAPGFSNSPCTLSLGLNTGEDPTTQTHIITLYYYIANDGTNTPVLYCDARRDNLTANTTETSAPLPIISNVEGMRVLYGWEDADTDADGDVDTDDGTPNIVYLDADTLDNLSDLNYVNVDGSTTTKTPWEFVASIRINFILQSENQDVAETPITSITINGNRAHTTRNASEQRLYRVFSTTTALRNYL